MTLSIKHFLLLVFMILPLGISSETLAPFSRGLYEVHRGITRRKVCVKYMGGITRRKVCVKYIGV